MSSIHAFANLAHFDGPAFELESIDFESQEITEIEDLCDFEFEVTEPIPESSDEMNDAQTRSPSSYLGFLFRLV